MVIRGPYLDFMSVFRSINLLCQGFLFRSGLRQPSKALLSQFDFKNFFVNVLFKMSFLFEVEVLTAFLDFLTILVSTYSMRLSDFSSTCFVCPLLLCHGN